MDMGKLFDTATAAVDRGNYDYAITLLIDLLKMQPDHDEGRKKLRETVVRKFQQSGKSGGAGAWIAGLPSVIKILIAKMTKKHDKVLMECESFLLNDPRNKTVLSWLAASALALGHNQVALDTLEWIHENYRKDAKVVFRLSQIYASERDIPKATECLEIYRRMKPDDREAELLLRNLAAEQTIDRGYGREVKAGSSRELVADKEETQRLVDEQRILRTQDDVARSLQRAEKDAELDPKNRKALASLAQLYRRVGRLDDAMKTFQRVLQLDSSNIEIQDALGDTKREKMLVEIRELEQKAGQPGAPAELAQQIEAKQKAVEEYWGTELDRRVKARPTDLSMRFLYGSYLFERGRWDAALAQLQFAQRDPRHRREARNKVGQCLFNKGMYDLAEKSYEAAFEGVEFFDAQVKEILYNWAMAAEKAGHTDVYEDKIRRIYDNDVAFRDVGKRMEDFYKARRGDK